MLRIAVLGCVLGSLGGAAAADDDGVAAATIQVSADATVTSAPDRAEVDVAVVTRAPAARDATAANASQLQQVLATLRSSLAPPPRLETVGYTIQPERTQPSSERAAQVTGYTARSVVRVTLRDVGQVGRVIDLVTGAGANEIAAVRFTVADDHAARARALREAAAAARAKATAVAGALGLEVVRVRSVAETGPTPRPVRELAFARRAPSTPVLAGPIEITATVTLTLEVTPASSRAASAYEDLGGARTAPRVRAR